MNATEISETRRENAAASSPEFKQSVGQAEKLEIWDCL